MRMALVLALAACSSPTRIDGGSDALADTGADTSTTVFCTTPPPYGLKTDGGGCGFTYANCSDGRVYKVTCGGPTPACECSIEEDGGVVSSKMEPYDECRLLPDEWLKEINKDCGWNIASK